ncbi:MAG: dihydrofolate reductase family protein [Nocardioides sp.]
MTTVQYFTACTLDGFIADEHDSLDWLFEVPHGEDDGSWEEFIGGVGVLVMGATTYQWVLDHEDVLAQPEKWREWYGDRPTYVFSHRDLPGIPGVEVRHVSGSVCDQYAAMAAAAGDRSVWVVGGGDLVGQFDDAGLLDEIWLGMTPVTLGAGRPLLPRRITSERLRLRSVSQSGQRVRIILDVTRRQD